MTNPLHNYGDPNVRASDADRERIAEILRTHHAEGRLDSEELQQRIDGCYDAKTIGELKALLVDLPRQHPHADDADPMPFGVGLGLGRGRRHTGRLWPLVVALVAIAIVTSHFFWFAIPLFFLAARVVMPRCRRRPGIRAYWA